MKLALLASRGAGTHDYVPVSSMWDQVKGWTSVLLNLTWKMFLQTILKIYTANTLDTGMQIIPTLFFMLNTQNPSIKAFIKRVYGAATYSETSGICFGKYLPAMKMFLKFWLKYLNLLSFTFYFCIIILESIFLGYFCVVWLTWLCFYQTRSAWSRDQGSNKNHSPAHNFAPTVTKFCVIWEGLSHPHDTQFGNCRCKIKDSRVFPIWSLIHGSSWSGLIKAEPGQMVW